MKKIILLAMLFATITFGQSVSHFFFFYKSVVEEVAEINPDYNILRDADMNIVKDADGKIILVRKTSQYAFNFNNEFQYYVRSKNEKYIFDSRLIAVINNRKRTNVL